jgi:L-lysine exporter family protein LysE/ArgO
MVESIITGFLLGSSLIIAIGAQNIFVLRQGIMRQHIFITSLYCSISDTILIFLGIVGVSIFFDNFIYKYSDFLFVFSAIWLFSYGLIRFFSAIKSNSSFSIESEKKKDIFSTLSMLTVLTFANPHVYLDTIVLIGSISQQFSGNEKFLFGAGASLSSFIFFFSLAYGAKLIVPYMKNTSSWRILDFVIAIIMFVISFNLLEQISIQ